MSLRILLLLLFAVCAPVLSADNKTYFNCLRKGFNDCAKNTDCKDGICDCDTTTKGHDCSIGTPVTTCANCTSGKSLCKDNSTGCLCNPDVYGPECQFNVYQAQCTNEGKMIININSPGITKPGVGMYIKGSPQCNETGLSAKPNSTSNFTSKWEGIILEVPTNQSEVCKALAVNDSSTDQGYCVTLVVHFQKDYLTSLDFQVKFCCLDIETNITVGSAKPMETDRLKPDVLIKSSLNDDLSSSMTDDNGQTIKDNGSRNLGDELRLKFQLKETSSFSGLKVIRCEANDNEKNGKAVIFLENGCLLSDKYIGKDISRTSVPPMIEVVTEVIKFIGTEKVQFKCLVRICVDATTCAKTIDCENGTVGRRKREAGNPSETKEGEITKYIRVVAPNSAAVDSGRQPLDNTQDPEAVTKTGYIDITAAVIGLAVVVMVLLLIIFVLAACLCARRALFDVSKG